MTRTPLALLAAITVAVTGCGILPGGQSSSPPPPAATMPVDAGGPPPAPLSWHSCPAQGAGVVCASLRVPLDYSHPDGRKITLALSEVRATAPASQQQGILLVNPGGPGGPGLPWASYLQQGLRPSVAAQYDIVGFDTRGTGSSSPALHCEPDYYATTRPDYIPADAAAEQVLIDRAKAYAADCEQRFGWLLPYMTTVNIARDMDQIRAAMGQRQLTYVSYSYGTYIGQVYATMFPHRVRRMVLDSTVDPKGVWYADNIAQDYAFQGRMEAFFGWVAKYDSLYHLGTTRAEVSQAWYKARAQLAAHPAAQASGPGIGASEFDDTFLNGGYQNAFWPSLASALSSYLRTGSTSELIAASNQNPTTENELAVYTAVECADVAWPRNWATWQADILKVDKTAPFQAWDNGWFNAPCAFWPVSAPAQPPKVGTADLPGILMLQGTLDAATPYAGALNARRKFPTARMVAVTGGGNHGQSLASPPNTCVDGYLNNYLATGALPEGTGLVSATCPNLPDPQPAG